MKGIVGRDLDELISEIVMDQYCTAEDEPAPYSTSIKHAWEVVEVLRDRFALLVSVKTGTPGSGYGVQLARTDEERWRPAIWLPTAEFAICYAALTCKEVLKAAVCMARKPLRAGDPLTTIPCGQSTRWLCLSWGALCDPCFRKHQGAECKAVHLDQLAPAESIAHALHERDES